MRPEEALSYLHGLFRPGTRAAAPGLERIRELLTRLDHPEAGLRTVHITGTNGKGSVAAMVAAMLGAAGYRTGLFISPYLERFSERIVLDGRELPQAELPALVASVKAAIEAMAVAGLPSPTEFEAVTALACLYFQRAGAEVISCEVGLGGRNDATNAIPGSLVSVITSIGLDHVERIGPGIADIASEKAGIIRPGGIVVTGRLPEAAGVVVRAEAERQGARLLRLGHEFSSRPSEFSLAGCMTTVDLPAQGESYPDLAVPLLGRHQADNLAVAVAAVREAAATAGLPVSAQAIRAGLAATRWPGRIEIISHKPLILLDGAHNPQAIEALARTLSELFRGRRIIAVLGSLTEHAQATAFDSLVPLLHSAVVTTPPFGPRAMPATELARRMAERFPELHVMQADQVPDAIAAALAALDDGQADLMLVTGSFYLVGEARGILKRLRAGEPEETRH